MRKFILFGSMLTFFLPAVCSGMTPEQFHQLPCATRQGYIEFLLQESMAGLEQHNEKQNSDQLKQILSDLLDRSGNIFTIKFFGNVEILEMLNANQKKDGAAAYQIENAFSVTLKEYNITVPANYLLGKSSEYSLTSDYAEKLTEPVIWPPNIDPEWKKKIMGFYAVADKVHRGYANYMCEYRENEDLQSSRLRRQNNDSPSLPNYRHAYVNSVGVIVDDKGQKLVGDELKTASTHPADELPKYEQMLQWNKQLSDDIAAIKRIKTNDDEAVAEWKKEETEIEECAVHKCTAYSKAN